MCSNHWRSLSNHQNVFKINSYEKYMEEVSANFCPFIVLFFNGM